MPCDIPAFPVLVLAFRLGRLTPVTLGYGLNAVKTEVQGVGWQLKVRESYMLKTTRSFMAEDANGNEVFIDLHTIVIQVDRSEVEVSGRIWAKVGHPGMPVIEWISVDSKIFDEATL